MSFMWEERLAAAFFFVLCAAVTCSVVIGVVMLARAAFKAW